MVLLFFPPNAKIHPTCAAHAFAVLGRSKYGYFDKFAARKGTVVKRRKFLILKSLITLVNTRAPPY